MTTDLMTLRAVSNALWPALRRDRWQRHRETRDLADHGSKPNFRSIGTATIHSVPRELDRHVITDERFIRATIWAEEWPGGKNLVIQLTEAQYLQAINALGHEDFYPLYTAYHLATCRAPFHAQANRHGVMGLRRNGTDELITPAVATALEAIAAHADVREVSQHDLDDALLRDEEIDLDQVRASVGLTPLTPYT